MKELTIKILFELKKKDYLLNLVSKEDGLDNKIETPELNRPGLAFSGYLDTFANDRIQIIGTTEVMFLKSLSPTKRYEAIKNVLSQYKIPCIIIANGFSPPKELVFMSDEYNIPLIRSQLKTIKLCQGLRNFLEGWFVRKKSIHGTLVDVIGVGVLITGKSGIGKSECALELISRGHRLIADDVVNIKGTSDILMGEANEKIGHFMEIRGIGMIDIETMYGISAIRLQKRVETQVELIPWRPNMDYERIGLKERYNRILDIEIPIIYLPVSPGKSIAVIIEVIAMNHMLKVYGYNAAEVLNKRIQSEFQRKNRTRTYLETDRE